MVLHYILASILAPPTPSPARNACSLLMHFTIQMCFKKPLFLDQERYQQLSNLWWMATSVSNGFKTGMRLTLSRWFQRQLLIGGNLPSIFTFAVALCLSKSILTPNKRKHDLKQIWVVGVLFESSWRGPEPLLTEFGTYHRLERYAKHIFTHPLKARIPLLMFYQFQ